jgi:predicted nucleic acid-binding protein
MLLIEARGSGFAVSSLTQVEFRSAIRKMERMKEMDPIFALKAIARFEGHLEVNYVTESIDIAILDGAKSLVDLYGLRAYDAVQLASCLSVRRAAGESTIFVSGDRDLLRAAAAEGLQVLNPTD